MCTWSDRNRVHLSTYAESSLQVCFWRTFKKRKEGRKLYRVLCNIDIKTIYRKADTTQKYLFYFIILFYIGRYHTKGCRRTILKNSHIAGMHPTKKICLEGLQGQACNCNQACVQWWLQQALSWSILPSCIKSQKGYQICEAHVYRLPKFLRPDTERDLAADPIHEKFLRGMSPDVIEVFKTCEACPTSTMLSQACRVLNFAWSEAKPYDVAMTWL